MPFIHLVVTHENDVGKKAYVNSVEMTGSYGGTNHTSSAITFSNYAIGRDHWTDSGTETTKYLRYYNSVLTQSQALSLYNFYNEA